jgi:hypothetical protein
MDPMQIVLTVTPQPDGQAAVAMQHTGLTWEGVVDVLLTALVTARTQAKAQAQSRLVQANGTQVGLYS